MPRVETIEEEDEDDEEEEQVTAVSDLPADEEPLPEVSRPKRRAKATETCTATTTTTTTSDTSISTLSDGKLLQVLTARAVDSESLKKRLTDMLGVKDPLDNEKMNWGQWMASCAYQVPRERWASFRQETYDLLCSYVPHTLQPVATTTTTITTSTVARTDTVTTAAVSRSLSAPAESTGSSGPSTTFSQQSYHQLQSFGGGDQYLQQTPQSSGFYTNYPSSQSGYTPSMYSQGPSGRFTQGQSSAPSVAAGSSGLQSQGQGQVPSYSPSHRAFSNLSTPELPSGDTSFSPSFTSLLLNPDGDN